MLEINTGYKKGDAVTIVTETLTELVGRFVREDDTSIVLSSVRMIVPQAGHDGSVGISLQPLIYSSENGHKAEMTFKKSNIVATLKALKNIDDTLRQEDTGIVM